MLCVIKAGGDAESCIWNLGLSAAGTSAANRQMLLVLVLVLLDPRGLVMSSPCHSDKDKDHRPRVSCVGQNLSAVPDGTDLGTQVLVLSQNQFVSLSWASYDKFTELHELDLSQNHVRVIDPSGPVLQNLKVLRLSRNRLEGLGGRVFRFAPALMEVYLDRNALRTLHDATFGDLLHLEVINLYGNQLPALPRRLLHSISSKSLKTFDLEDNRVQHLPDGFFNSTPDLPYVYLSQNPWLCSCQVNYLYHYLEAAGFNVYKHTTGTAPGPPGDRDMATNIENDPESVVCSGPPSLRGRAVIDLSEDEYCIPSTPTAHSHEESSTNSVSATSESTISSATSESTISSATSESTISSATTATTHTGVTTEVIRPTTKAIREVSTSTATTITPSPEPSTFLQTSTASRIWTEFESWTVWTAVWRQWFSESGSFNRTVAAEVHPTASSNHQETSPEVPASTVHPQTSPIPLPWTTRPEPQATSFTSQPRTSRPSSSTVPGPETSVPFRYIFGSSSGCVVPWCWWLFAGFLPLCVLSALCSCMLFLWILITYLTLYKPVQKHIRKQDSEVMLLNFRNNPGGMRGGGGTGKDTVMFLPPEKIPVENRAVFRSVLFIVKEDEEGEKVGRREGARDEDNTVTKIELVPKVEEEEEEERTKVRTRRDKGEQREVTDSQEVFRKTLYRVISQEEEIEEWREVEESWGLAERGAGERGVGGRGVGERGVGERGKKRYSLILREERESVVDGDGGMEWLVGEWEMGGGGRMREGSWGSLIRRVEGGASLTPPIPAEGSQTNKREGVGASDERGGATADRGGAIAERGGTTAGGGTATAEEGGAADAPSRWAWSNATEI